MYKEDVDAIYEHVVVAPSVVAATETSNEHAVKNYTFLLLKHTT